MSSEAPQHSYHLCMCAKSTWNLLSQRISSLHYSMILYSTLVYYFPMSPTALLTHWRPCFTIGCQQFKQSNILSIISQLSLGPLSWVSPNYSTTMTSLGHLTVLPSTERASFTQKALSKCLTLLNLCAFCDPTFPTSLNHS